MPRKAVDTANDAAPAKTGGAAEVSLAHDMIAVHGDEAGIVARGNARTAALGGEGSRAKFWIRVLGIIQRDQAGKPARATDD
jgi:hypothetical protein